MNIFAIGDVHLSLDERVQKPMDVFGPRWANHAERLRENWLNLVSEDDLVIICGDISWGLRLEEAMADLLFLDELPGTKVITKGNHDLWWNSVSKLNKISERMIFLQNKAFLLPGAVDFNSSATTSDDRIAICGTRGWICPGTEGFDAHDQKIYDREILRLRMSLDDAVKQGATKIIASLHYPPSNDKFEASGFTETLSEYGVKTCVYGHLHGKDAFKNGYKGIWNGVEYKLVSLDYVEAMPVKI